MGYIHVTARFHLNSLWDDYTEFFETIVDRVTLYLVSESGSVKNMSLSSLSVFPVPGVGRGLGC